MLSHGLSSRSYGRGIFHSVELLFLSIFFFREVLSPEIEEPSEKTVCTSVVARVSAVCDFWSSTVLGAPYAYSSSDQRGPRKNEYELLRLRQLE